MKKKLIILAVICVLLNSALITDSYSASSIPTKNPLTKVKIISKVKKFKYAQVKGKGPLPYNYRIIDDVIHAGGQPLNPATMYGNRDTYVISIMKYFQTKGIKTVVNLHWTPPMIKRRYQKFLKKFGIKEIFIPMNSQKVPTKKEWNTIKKALKKPVYIHCMWGADRTGSIIAKYLVDVKNYTPKEAWKAVISKGSHSGVIGGLKKSRGYRNLVIFFWPDAMKDKDIQKYYK